MGASGSKKRKWPWILGAAVILPVLAVIWLDSTAASYYIIHPRSVVTHTREELVDLYWEHKDELQEVAEIVLANDVLKQRIINNNDDYAHTNSKSGTNVFPEEDWNKIVALYQKIRCRNIVRRCWYGADGAVSVEFKGRKVDGQDVSTRLFYFKDETTMRVYRNLRYRGWGSWQVWEHLDGGWYIFEYIGQI